MHADDQAGAPEWADTPLSGVGQLVKRCHSPPCSAVRECSKGCDGVGYMTLKHIASSEGSFQLHVVRLASDIDVTCRLDLLGALAGALHAGQFSGHTASAVQSFHKSNNMS
jgi:hypothetical protein